MFRETLNISSYLLIKTFGFNPIQFCQIPVNHYLFASQGKDTVFYWHCQPVTICDRFLVRCILY